MELITALIVGVAASFVAALVFLAFLHGIRPRVEIGDHIARRLDDESRKRFEVKLINKSRRAIIDVCPKLEIVHVTYPAGGHHLMTVEDVKLKTGHLFILEGYKSRDPDARYAVRFATSEDIDEKWRDDHSYLRFVVKITDRISGISDVFEKHFRGRSAIKDGRFKTGKSTEIV